MEIRLWGTRGSIPAPGPATLRYGGNTSCVEVRLDDGSLIIIDAGSGIGALGDALGPCEATILLSHYHWDHIQGMPFFGPAYTSESTVRVLGPECEGKGPETWLTGQMLNPHFRIAPSCWAGIAGYDVMLPGETRTIGRARVRAGRLSHPNGTLGYRIEDGDRTFVYASDNEPATADPDLLDEILALASGADLLLHDCQYFESEYATRRCWGHSTPRQAARVATEAGVRRLLLFHHDPGHSDDQVEALAAEACELAGGIDVVIAREGERLALESAPVAVSPRPLSSR